jgi:hypothetical protein
MSASFIAETETHYFDNDDDLVFNDDFSFNNENYNHNLKGYDYKDLQEKFYTKFNANKVQKLNKRQDESCSSDLSKADVHKIHQELNLIHHKLVVCCLLN